MSVFRKFGKRSILLFIMSIGLKYSYGQLPSANPLYDSVFVEQFSDSVYNTAEWQPCYDWGTFFNIDTVRCGATPGNIGVLVDVPSLNLNPLDTHSRVMTGSTCQMILRKENNMGSVIRYFPDCLSPECFNGWCDTLKDTCGNWVQIPFRLSNAMLHSKDKYKYGYIENRFRFPGWTANTKNGFQPSFWMFSGSSTVPWSEIDIYEFFGTTGKLTNNIHVDAVADINKNASYDGMPGPIDTFFLDLSQWHTTAIDWTPTYIDFYIDGSFVRRSTNDTNQYLLPMPIILDNGAPLAFGCVKADSITAVTYEIDYVKVWQPKLACDTVKSYCNVTTSTFSSKIYKSLTIGGSGCSAVFNNGKASAVATDYVLLNEGFEISNNMEMLINVEPCWEEMKHIQGIGLDHPIPLPDNLKQIQQQKQHE